MKTALILVCLISLSLTATVPACYPNYKNGVTFASECKGVAITMNAAWLPILILSQMFIMYAMNLMLICLSVLMNINKR